MFKTVHKLPANHFNVIKRLPALYSTKPVIKEKADDNDQLKEFERISNITQKTRTKLPQKPPFVKNLLVGIFDTDILTYPQLEKEEWTSLEKNVKVAENALRQPDVKEAKTLTRQLMATLSKNRLLGLQTSQLLDGRELTVTESNRFLELLADLNLKYPIINSEQTAVQILTKFGSDKLKRKYLHKLISGEAVSAFCVIEALPNNIDVLKRTALLSGDSKTWVLNGQSKLVLNAANADFLIVIAHSDVIFKDKLEEQKLTAFVLERDFGGITCTKRTSVSQFFEPADMLFENTHIPAENVIGQVHGGEEILRAIYPEHRLCMGSVCSVLNRNLINETIKYCIKSSTETQPLYETDAIRGKIAELITSNYVIESMTYLTAGLIDTYENQDCELESTIVKVFSSEQTFANTTSCLNLIGLEASLEDHWCSQYHKEAMCYVNFPESNDALKTLIALFGLRHAGQHINELVKKLRNPLFNAMYFFKRLWTHRKHREDVAKLDLYLHYYLHPSFITAANNLEYCVIRLQYVTEILLGRYGPDVISKHMELRRLAESLIDIYGMVACISRASRSYCIGLQHGEFEMVLASSFCVQGKERVRSNLQKIIDGPYQTNDENYRTIAQRSFQFKEYFPVHPLSRNF